MDGMEQNSVKMFLNKLRTRTLYINPIPYGLFNKPNLMDGAISHIWLSEDIFKKIRFNMGLVKM